MNNKNDEILLHDYFDNILSEVEQKEFEEYLIDNINLAIDLGKLKNLREKIINLKSNFTPPETIIEKTVQTLIENTEIDKIPDEVTDENLIIIEEKNTEKIKEAEIEKKTKKEKRKLRPKTKHKLKRAFSVFAIIIFLVVLETGYYFYNKANSTTPWNITLLSTNNSQSLKDIETHGLEINSVIKTSDSEMLEINIEDKGKLELSNNSKIKVVSGTKSLNSIIYYFGTMTFTPELNNQVFSMTYNNLNIESIDSKFSVSENKGDIQVNVKTNFITINDGNNKYNIPKNYEFRIINTNKISIPINHNSAINFIKLIDSYSLSPNEFLIKKIINSATDKEFFTLYFLLSQVTPVYRELIIEKLQKYAPIPSSISKENILMLNQVALEDWWNEVYSNLE